MDALLVAAMLAVSLLPNITIGDRRETRATASNSTVAVSTLNRDVGSCREVVMYCTLCCLGLANTDTVATIVINMARLKNIFFIISCTLPCRAQLLIVIIDCLSVYVYHISHVTILSYFFAFCSASSARRIYDLALERALSALRLLSSALSIAFRAFRSELRACSYCF